MEVRHYEYSVVNVLETSKLAVRNWTWQREHFSA